MLKLPSLLPRKLRIKSQGDGARLYGIAGATVILVVFGGLLEWSLIAPLDGAVIAPATVKVESNRKAIQHLEGGIVSQILAVEGRYVEAGDSLVRLDDTVARANLDLVDGQLDELSARRARLVAERDAHERVLYPKVLYERSHINSAAEAMAGQIALFDARRATLATEFELLEQRITQHNERIGGINAQVASKERQIRLLEKEIAGLRQLYEKGYARLPRILELERQAERLRGEKGEHFAEIAEAKTAIGEAKMEMVRRTDDFREDVVSELRETETRMVELIERRVAAEDTLKRMEIRAPRAGRVLGLNVHTIGGVVAPGEALMEIVPDSDALVLAAQVRPEDIDKVTIDSDTIIRFTAFNQRTTPEFQGRVKKVSVDRLVDDATQQPYYMAIVEIPDGAFEHLGRFSIAPGMPAETFIRTGERTAISYLLKPFTDNLARAMREE